MFRLTVTRYKLTKDTLNIKQMPDQELAMIDLKSVNIKKAKGVIPLAFYD